MIGRQRMGQKTQLRLRRNYAINIKISSQCVFNKNAVELCPRQESNL